MIAQARDPAGGGAARIGRRIWIPAGVAALLLAAAMLEITVSGPRVYVRWSDDLTADGRIVRERQYDLRDGEPDRSSPETWQYALGTRSSDNLAALLSDPAVVDTHNIDRDALTVPRPDVRITMRGLPGSAALPFPFSTTDEFDEPWRLFQVQSLWLALGSVFLLWASGMSSPARRRTLTLAVLLGVGAAGLVFPIPRTMVRMGDANQLTSTRVNFESQAGVRFVRSEAHLSFALLGQLDRMLGRTEDSPRRAQTVLVRAATVWFVLLAVGVGVMERWSALALRYLALAVAAPAALMYFGWRELGYLSLNVAAFPLIARGLRDGGPRVEAAGLLIGLGAAFHGWGLVSLAGAWLAALAAPAPLVGRTARLLRLTAWATAGYAGWLPVYIIVLKLPIYLGHVDAVPWRPWFEDTVGFYRVNPAIFSAAGARLLLMTAWVIGAPLVLVAASLWREHREQARLALAYAVPSIVFTTLVWHSQGPHEDMDVVFAIFPGLYALTWLCAHDRRRSVVALVLLLSGHLAFWRIVLDPQFASAWAGP